MWHVCSVDVTHWNSALQRHCMSQNSVSDAVSRSYCALQRPLPALPPPSPVSTSFHALEDLGVCRGELDYVFLSPIYASISKPGHGGEGTTAAFPDADALASALAGSRYPVLALGGVTPERFAELADLGFAGAALLGSIWSAEDPLAAWEAARRAAERLP